MSEKVNLAAIGQTRKRRLREGRNSCGVLEREVRQKAVEGRENATMVGVAREKVHQVFPEHHDAQKTVCETLTFEARESITVREEDA
jgi:hypothetical protein